MTILDVFPYLRVESAAAAIQFYSAAFGALEKFRLVEPSGRIGHAEILLGNFTVMLSDEFPEYNISGPRKLGGTSVGLHLHVADVDAAHAQALAAGAEEIMPPRDQFYGERASKVRDPFGHEWLLGTEIEKVTPEEMQRRYNALF